MLLNYVNVKSYVRNLKEQIDLSEMICRFFRRIEISVQVKLASEALVCSFQRAGGCQVSVDRKCVRTSSGYQRKIPPFSTKYTNVRKVLHFSPHFLFNEKRDSDVTHIFHKIINISNFFKMQQICQITWIIPCDPFECLTVGNVYTPELLCNL